MPALNSLLPKAAARFRRHQPELRFALRATVAGMVAVVLSDLLGLTQGYWAVLTSVLVLQSTIGGSLKAACDRLVATLLGGVCGLAGAYAVLEGLLSDASALALLIFLLSLLASSRPNYRLAPVTAAIVLLIDPGHAHALESATHRVLNIAIGSVIGLAVALVVLPARAHVGLAQQAGKLLALLAETLELGLAPLTGSGGDPRQQQGLRDKIRLAIAALETRGQEAQQERSAFLTGEADPDALVRTLRRLRTDLMLLGRAAARPWPDSLEPRLRTPLGQLAAALANHLRAMGEAARERRKAPDPAAAFAALDAFSRALQGCREEGLLRGMPAEGISSLYALGFSLDQVRRELLQLGGRLDELALPERR